MNHGSGETFGKSDANRDVDGDSEQLDGIYDSNIRAVASGLSSSSVAAAAERALFHRLLDGAGSRHLGVQEGTNTSLYVPSTRQSIQDIPHVNAISSRIGTSNLESSHNGHIDLHGYRHQPTTSSSVAAAMMSQHYQHQYGSNSLDLASLGRRRYDGLHSSWVPPAMRDELSSTMTRAEAAALLPGHTNNMRLSTRPTLPSYQNGYSPPFEQNHSNIYNPSGTASSTAGLNAGDWMSTRQPMAQRHSPPSLHSFGMRTSTQAYYDSTSYSHLPDTAGSSSTFAVGQPLSQYATSSTSSSLATSLHLGNSSVSLGNNQDRSVDVQQSRRTRSSIQAYYDSNSSSQLSDTAGSSSTFAVGKPLSQCATSSNSSSRATSLRRGNSSASLSDNQDRPVDVKQSSSVSLSNNQDRSIDVHQNSNSDNHATSLVITSDSIFLDPVHVFLRSACIEVFVSRRDDMMCPGRGARASKIGQVGLRCIYCRDVSRQQLARQAICYPSKRETIFESVRNYQRVHFEACRSISEETKDEYKRLLDANSSQRKSQRFVKAYYAEAASELGLVETPKGLVFGAPPNTSGTPSEKITAIIRAAETPANSFAFWKKYSPSSRDKSMELRKFEHVASEGTREVIRNARRETSAIVYPQDFPTVSDYEYLIYSQVQPCKPSDATLKRRGVDHEEHSTLCGLCCKHCALVHFRTVQAHQLQGHECPNPSHHKGMWFPINFQSLSDSSFSQSILNHMMTCHNVPEGVKEAFVELRQLASEHNVITKRGSKKKFLGKIWERMVKYYA